MPQIIPRADQICWGKGPRSLEIFLEPTNSFSLRAFGKMDAVLGAAGHDRITMRLWLHAQPWHMFLGIIVRCVSTGSMLSGGRAKARAILVAIAAHREEFEFDQHCHGPDMGITPRGVIARIENDSGLTLAEAFEVPELETEIRRHTRSARQNGIHASPTFMVDGLVQQDMSSGDLVESWAAQLVGQR